MWLCGYTQPDHGAVLPTKAEPRTTGFKVFAAGFGAHFIPIPPIHAPTVPFGMGIFTVCQFILEVCTCNLFALKMGLQLEVCFESQR